MTHIIKDHKRVRKGANQKKLLFAIQGKINSFIISLRASATAWPPPEIKTRLGPTRLWSVAITWRSKSVRKATTGRAGKITRRIEINVFIFTQLCLLSTCKTYGFKREKWNEMEFEVPLGTGILIASAGVILLRSPFYAIFSFVFTFFFVSGLCFVFGAEMIALLLIFVYLGSISILFLFTAMFIDLWGSRFYSFGFYLSRNLAVAVLWCFSVWLIPIFLASSLPISLQSHDFDSSHFQWVDFYSASSNMSHINQIGLFLYSDYSLPFILAAYHLLVSMIAAIVISLAGEHPPLLMQYWECRHSFLFDLAVSSSQQAIVFSLSYYWIECLSDSYLYYVGLNLLLL